MENNVRPASMARITTPELADAFINEQVAAIRAQVGDGKVLLALSGGVDSSVAELRKNDRVIEKLKEVLNCS